MGERKVRKDESEVRRAERRLQKENGEIDSEEAKDSESEIFSEGGESDISEDSKGSKDSKYSQMEDTRKKTIGKQPSSGSVMKGSGAASGAEGKGSVTMDIGID